MTKSESKSGSLSSTSRRGLVGVLDRLLSVAHWLVLLALVAGVTVWAIMPFVRAASRTRHETLPHTMEQVDWSSPESSLYCVACHKQVGPAMAGLDVEQGHPHNVHLTAAQLESIEDMGAVAGPDGTLICMSCHKLDPEAGATHMLADTLVGSKLCVRCHPDQVPKCDSRHDLRTSAPEERNRLGQTTAEAGPCSACHLAHHYARDFVPTELDPDGRCITCHEPGRAAAKLARQTMEHPRTRCTECHDPHDSCTGHFLEQPASQLCVSCHDKMGGGVAAGMHPVGKMDYPVPQALLDAGAAVGKDPHELTCLVCHSTHSSTHEPLLVIEPDSNSLCLACHEDQLTKKTADGKLPGHGRCPPLNDDQRAAVTQWGGRVDSEGKLLCVSCHRVHGGQPGADLLRFRPKYDEVCTACHPGPAAVAGTSHDLRTRLPNEKNVAGMTAADAGSCSACHLAHGTARKPVITVGDPVGQCTTCHQQGQCAGNMLAGEVSHPQTACTDCHNPHNNGHGAYLVKPEADLCVSCHAGQAKLSGGPHDFAAKPEAWPKAAADAPGRCLPCHVPHGGQRTDLFRFEAPAGDSHHDGVCLTCHPNVAWGASTKIAVIHPHDISPDQHKVPLALVPKDDAGNLRMGCRTCHDPHGGADPVHLARVAPGEASAKVCLHCHGDKELISLTGHAPEKLEKHGFNVDSCKPCHAMHANPDGSWGQMLSPRFLMEKCDPQAMQADTCVPCMACHHPGGPAPVREIVTHPEVGMTNRLERGSPGYLPLFDAAGREDPNGQIACRTCHVSHGRLDLLKAVAENRELSPEDQGAMRMQLRGFVAPNICTECHGEEARVKFLFFHNPRHRTTQPK